MRIFSYIYFNLVFPGDFLIAQKQKEFWREL